MTSLRPNSIEILLKLLQNFKLDSYPQQIVQNLNDLSDLSKNDKFILCDIIYGCNDNIRVLNVVVDGYYFKEGKNCSINDKNMYYVIAYIIIYKINQNGINELQLLKKFPEEKLYNFLKYFLNEKNILTWMKDAWSLHFETEFVEKQLINPILSILSDLDAFMKELEDSIFNFNSKTKTTTMHTRVQPFNLTNQSRKKILLPEQILTDSNLNRRTKLSKSTTEINNIDHSKKIQIRNKVPIPPRKIRSSPVKDEKKELTDTKKVFKATPYQPIQNESEPIKLNTAVILKDEFLIRKQADEVVKKFAFLELGEGNSDEFLKWQANMKQNDLKLKQEQAEIKKIQSKLAYEEAILAKNNLIESNKKKAQEFQKENEKLELKIMENKKNDKYKKSMLVKEIQEDENKVKEIKLKVKKEKKNIVMQMIKESEKLESQALKQMESDMKKRLELIQQIKAADSISIHKTKLVDLTSNSGHKLLSEMSIVELRERLELTKKQNEELNKQKHDEIIKSKMLKDQTLIDKLQFINTFRNENISVAENNNKNSSSVEFEREKNNQEKDSITELKKKLVEIRYERASSSKSSLMHTNEKKYSIYQNQRKALEQNRFQDLENTHERLRLISQ